MIDRRRPTYSLYSQPSYKNFQQPRYTSKNSLGQVYTPPTTLLHGVAVSRLDKIKALKKFGSLPENTNFGVKTSVVRSILESSNVSSPSPNRSSISKSKLAKMISGGTYYLSCWMTTAQIEKMRSKKVIFQNLD